MSLCLVQVVVITAVRDGLVHQIVPSVQIGDWRRKCTDTREVKKPSRKPMLNASRAGLKKSKR